MCSREREREEERRTGLVSLRNSAGLNSLQGRTRGSPTIKQKRPTVEQKETYHKAKETCYKAQETKHAQGLKSLQGWTRVRIV
jgi:hypothetical protein